MLMRYSQYEEVRLALDIRDEFCSLRFVVAEEFDKSQLCKNDSLFRFKFVASQTRAGTEF